MQRSLPELREGFGGVWNAVHDRTSLHALPRSPRNAYGRETGNTRKVRARLQVARQSGDVLEVRRAEHVVALQNDDHVAARVPEVARVPLERRGVHVPRIRPEITVAEPNLDPPGPERAQHQRAQEEREGDVALLQY